MITLSVINGEAFVWNADDWLDLREKHRIVGKLIGCIAGCPRQELFSGLPLLLLPEEATLLVEKNIAKFISYSDITEVVSNSAREKFIEYKERIEQEQLTYYDDERKKRIVSMIDRIIEGKRRKIISTKGKKDQDSSANSGDVEINREAILKAELERASNVPVTNLVQTFTADVWHSAAVNDDVDWTFPKSKTEKLRYSVFKDLWERGYFITAGHTFGGDFLVYPGDPAKFHAQLIIVCLEMSTELTAADVVSYCRVGSSSRKTLVMATLNEDSCVIYQSLSWFDFLTH